MTEIGNNLKVILVAAVIIFTVIIATLTAYAAYMWYVKVRDAPPIEKQFEQYIGDPAAMDIKDITY